MVGVAGFELATPCTPCKCATRLRYTPTELGIIAAHRGANRRIQSASSESRMLRSSAFRSVVVARPKRVAGTEALADLIEPAV